MEETIPFQHKDKVISTKAILNSRAKVEIRTGTIGIVTTGENSLGRVLVLFQGRYSSIECPAGALRNINTALP